MGETRRLKFVVSYDGRGYAGWQSQVHGKTIQDHLEGAFGKIGGGKIAVMGAGRTDAGVHALGQCAHADVPAEKLAAMDWLKALNGTLPLTIRILRARFVPQAFHARFSARAKFYRYRIANSAIMSPLELGRAWHVARPLNVITLRKAAALFVGTHDFAGYAASRGKMETDTRRTITSVRVIHRGEVIAIEVWGDGFLYKMVRMMVGAIVRCALGKEPLEAIALRLGNGAPKPAPGTLALPETIASRSVSVGIGDAENADVGTKTMRPKISAPRFVAPAEGLYLVQVRY